MIFIFARIFILLPLIIALAVIERTRKAADKIPDVDDRADALREIKKGLCYVLIAGALGMWLIPSVDGVWLFFGLLVSSIFAAFVILSVVELPNWKPFNVVHNWSWGTWRETPIYSRTGEPVERVRWGRRFAFAAFVLVVACLAFFGGTPSSTTPNQATSYGTTPVSSTPAITPSTAAPATTTSQTPTTMNTAAPSTVVTTTTATLPPLSNPCDGPHSIPQKSPVTVTFGTGNMQLCFNGKWQTWGAINSMTPAPANVEIDGCVIPQGSSYAYGYMVVPSTRDGYPFRTSDFAGLAC